MPPTSGDNGAMTEAHTDQPRMIEDPKVLRALAHPARLEIVDYLSTSGSSVTATECAEIVGLSPSATSYHLRELAKVGMVEEAPSRGDGRERVWRSRGHSWGVAMAHDADPEVAAAEERLVEIYLARDTARLRAWLERARSEPREWHDASVYNGSTLLVTADELRALNERIRELIAPLKRRVRADDAPEGARTVALHLAAFPID
jgi:DNA-binding transcriptional ArsR family regulator